MSRKSKVKYKMKGHSIPGIKGFKDTSLEDGRAASSAFQMKESALKHSAIEGKVVPEHPHPHSENPEQLEVDFKNTTDNYNRYVEGGGELSIKDWFERPGNLNQGSYEEVFKNILTENTDPGTDVVGGITDPGKEYKITGGDPYEDTEFTKGTLDEYETPEHLKWKPGEGLSWGVGEVGKLLARQAAERKAKKEQKENNPGDVLTEKINENKTDIIKKEEKKDIVKGPDKELVQKTIQTKVETKPYEVKSGDNLSKIAMANNTTVEELMKKNPQIKDKNKIFSGQTINL